MKTFLWTLLICATASCGCPQKTIDEANAFIKAHQSCETNDDCRVIHDHCEMLSGGFCGQLAMNKEGAESAEWKALDRELGDCAPDSCERCLAALLPTCTNGSCGGG
jgi:hypothetical protein